MLHLMFFAVVLAIAITLLPATAPLIQAFDALFQVSAKIIDMVMWVYHTLIPPTDDIHYVKTVSEAPSISIHLLANDTACVWRHRFEPEKGTVTPFRSGYANAPCPEDRPPS